MSVSHFLLLTQRDTVPFLVLTKKKDILQRIATARSADTSIQDICLQPPANLAAVISTLLFQPSSDVEGNAIRCLAEVAPGIQTSDLGSLIRSNPVLIACEMLKTAGDEDESNAPKVRFLLRVSLFPILDSSVFTGTTRYPDFHYAGRGKTKPLKAKRQSQPYAY